MGEGEQMEESKSDERRHRRRPLNAAAAAALDGDLLFACRIVNFSEAGARLDIGVNDPPERFQLIDIDAGAAFSVRVVWRRSRTAGVAILHSRAVDDAGAPEWLTALWRRLKAARPNQSASAAA